MERYLATKGMITATGFDCDGYKVVKHLSYIADNEVSTINRSIAVNDDGVKDHVVKLLNQTREKALQKLKEDSYRLGGNAVTGINFDYITYNLHTATSPTGTIQPACIICAVASGNAVVVEKINK